MTSMTSRERVLTALKRMVPDRVPFVDIPDDGICRKIMGTNDYSSTNLLECKSIPKS